MRSYGPDYALKCLPPFLSLDPFPSVYTLTVFCFSLKFPPAPSLLTPCLAGWTRSSTPTRTPSEKSSCKREPPTWRPSGAAWKPGRPPPAHRGRPGCSARAAKSIRADERSDCEYPAAKKKKRQFSKREWKNVFEIGEKVHLLAHHPILSSYFTNICPFPLTAASPLFERASSLPYPTLPYPSLPYLTAPHSKDPEDQKWSSQWLEEKRAVARGKVLMSLGEEHLDRGERSYAEGRSGDSGRSRLRFSILRDSFVHVHISCAASVECSPLERNARGASTSTLPPSGINLRSQSLPSPLPLALPRPHPALRCRHTRASRLHQIHQAVQIRSGLPCRLPRRLAPPLHRGHAVGQEPRQHGRGDRARRRLGHRRGAV